MRLLSAAVIVLSLFALPVLAAEREPVPAHQKVNVVEVSPINDPIEPFNRAVFQFNRFVDFAILKPVTTVYKFVLPGFAQHSVTAFLSNLATPIDMMNNALQRDWAGFEANLHRFVVNSTLGVLGFVDVASDLGIQAVPADFGQTLGKWGVGHGFYLVLPIIGPSSARDGAGVAVDGFADPYNQVFMDSETEWPIYARMGLTAVDVRARYGDEIDRTMKTAVDPYVTFRSIYAQRRAYVVQTGKSAVDPYADAEAK